MSRPRKQEYNEPKRRCHAVVYVRDTYRRSGGKLHFKMHYARDRCRRASMMGYSYCWQHQTREPR